MKEYLYIPESFKKLNTEEINKICNGCGAKEGINVPDTFYGLSITEACDIHDYMYHMGKTIKDKEEADRVFLNNLLRIVNKESKCCVLKFLRRRRAKKYYLAVKILGGPAYWDNKIKPEK